VFCNQRRISGAVEPATSQTVKDAIENYYRTAAPDVPAELAFYGGSFTAIPPQEQEELLGAALPFLRMNSLNSIRLSTRPDCVDSSTIRRLKRYSVGTVELGCQSMCDDVLTLSNRGHSSEDVCRAAELIKRAGMELILQMMTGLPGDDTEKSIYTAKRLIALEPDGVRIYPTVIIRDTKLYDMWQDGTYAEHTVEQAVELCSVLAEMFIQAKIPIIRLGLNPTQELSGGAAAAGAYHPAFGELVYSRIYLKKAQRLLMGLDTENASVVFRVCRGRTSFMVGQKKCNILALKQRFGLKSVTVSDTGTIDGEIELISVEK
jgi:histone acetyltransferase (RNA polymerase elongator complex component)